MEKTITPTFKLDYNVRTYIVSPTLIIFDISHGIPERTCYKNFNRSHLLYCVTVKIYFWRDLVQVLGLVELLIIVPKKKIDYSPKSRFRRKEVFSVQSTSWSHISPLHHYSTALLGTGQKLPFCLWLFSWSICSRCYLTSKKSSSVVYKSLRLQPLRSFEVLPLSSCFIYLLPAAGHQAKVPYVY